MYATLAQIRSEIRENDPTNTVDDGVVLAALYQAERIFDLKTRREFAPRFETRYFDAVSIAKGGPVDGQDLWLDRDLLSVTTLTNGDGNVISSTNYTLFPRGDIAYTRIRLTLGQAAWAYSSDPMGAIRVLGTWGYHSRPTEGWLSSGDAVQNNPLASDGTSITVTDADGADALNRTPRFSPGQLLRIESEYVEVLAVNIETNTLTVRRGMRGTTAASHVQSTVIDIWQPEPPIERAMIRTAALLYKRRGEFVRATSDGFTTIQYPKELPDDVQAVLASYVRIGNIRK